MILRLFFAEQKAAGPRKGGVGLRYALQAD
jgi:hypothetical protein